VNHTYQRGGDHRNQHTGGKPENEAKASHEAIASKKSAAEVAKIVGTSRATVERARTVLNDGDATKAVLRGEHLRFIMAVDERKKRSEYQKRDDKEKYIPVPPNGGTGSKGSVSSKATADPLGEGLPLPLFIISYDTPKEIYPAAFWVSPSSSERFKAVSIKSEATSEARFKAASLMCEYRLVMRPSRCPNKV
jgi:hypothetical protein